MKMKCFASERLDEIPLSTSEMHQNPRPSVRACVRVLEDSQGTGRRGPEELPRRCCFCLPAYRYLLAAYAAIRRLGDEDRAAVQTRCSDAVDDIQIMAMNE
eukprot:GHVU01077361.1.p1 GENE.GHVU01077361.1~~GHVU01077361.1.p1  ORF type:complete len:101 (-),score=13.40 GHVU01077361.1:191-493(-)